MAADDPHPVLDRQALEGVARLTVAELQLTVPATKRGKIARSDEAQGGFVVGAIGTEAETEPRSDWVSAVELTRALEVALQKIVGLHDDRQRAVGRGIDDPVMSKLVARLPSMIEARKRALSEKNIEALIDAYLPTDPLATVMPEIEADNARAQAEFLQRHRTLTAEQVAEHAGHNASNRSATANRWKGDKKVFSVRAGGRELYPAFQFRDGRPRTTLQPTLRALGSLTGWQTAFWFVTPNSWLGGPAPIERLDDGDALLAAAHHEAETWVG